jgi:hypothetical protein
MKRRFAALASKLNVFDAKLLLRNHRSTEYGSPMTASWLGARSVLRPESVDDLWSIVAIALPLPRREK